VNIRLPDDFSHAHRTMVLRFVQGKAMNTDQRALQLEAFDILHRATADDGTFAAFYARVVEEPSADPYIVTLLEASNPKAAAAKLRQKVSEQIAVRLRQAGCLNPYQTSDFYLLAYCLYWWHAFTIGYEFEITILRDLKDSGVDFYAHDLRDHRARRSPFDLFVMNFSGDIKTSTYFLYAVRSTGLPADFYITRLYNRLGKERLLVVFLKQPAWDAIDGETIPTRLSALPDVLPAAAEIEHGGRTLIVIDYVEWKTRLLRRQRRK